MSWRDGGFEVLRLGGRAVRGLEWVGHSVYNNDEWKKKGFLGPRFVRLQRETAPPLGLRGVQGRFRQGAAPCRCVVDESVPAASDDVFSAVSEAVTFLGCLTYYLRAYTVGGYGVTDETRHVLDKARVCWDWGYLLTHEPQSNHIRAFVDLYKALLPTLKNTEWPSTPESNFLEHKIVQIRGTNGAVDQYRRLVHRARRAASKRIAWRSAASSSVEPVLYSTPFLQVLLGRMFKRHKGVSVHAIRCILHVVSSFLVEAARAVITRAAFEASAIDLATPGHGSTLRKARGRRRQQEYREEQIAAALLSDFDFVKPSRSKEGNRHCWHALRVYMRTRMMRAPESGCERWGSLMHALCHPVAGWNPHRIVSRLLIREAIFDGCNREHEDSVHELAAALDGWMGKEATFSKRRKTVDTRTVVDQKNLVVRRMLREQQIVAEQWKQTARPVGLLPAAAAAVQDAMRLGGDWKGEKHLQELPAFAEDMRTTRKNRAGSSVAEALANFMRSDEGRQWQQDRKAMFGATFPENGD